MSGKKVRDIVELYLLRNRHKPGVAANRLLIDQLGIDAYRDLNLNVLSQHSIKVVYLPVSDAKTVAMPADYVNYVKIGLPVNNELWTLTVNETLLPPKTTCNDCNLTVEEALAAGTDYFNTGWYFTSHYDKNGTFIGKLYGVGGGFNSRGYFKEDLPNRRFILDRVPASEVVLEYKSNNLDLDAIVPEYAIEAVIEFITWQMARSFGNASEREEARQLYLNRQQFIVQYTTPVRLDEFLDSYNKNVYFGPKR